MNIKWDKILVFEKSKEYSSRIDFQKGCSSAYNVALKNKWLDEMVWLKPKPRKKKYTKEVVFEVSKSFTSRSEFCKKNLRAYLIALKNKWIDEMVWLKPKKRKLPEVVKWTKENVFNESKKYTSRVDFQNGNRSAYDVAWKNKWLDEMVWLIPKLKPRGYWNKERVFEESKKYSTIFDFKTNSKTAYRVAANNKWIGEMIWLKRKEPNYLFCVYVYIDEDNKCAYVGLTKNKEERHNVHKTGKYHSVKNESSVFKYFTKLNKEVPDPTYLEMDLLADDAKIKEDEWRMFYEKMGYHMLNERKTGLMSSSIGGPYKWTKNKVFEEAKKYSSRLDFSKGCKTAYNKAVAENWLDEMEWLSLKTTKWTKELVIKESKKYDSVSNFMKKSIGAYMFAKRNGFLNELEFKQMVTTWTKEKVLEVRSQCKNISEFGKKYIGAYAFAKRNGFLNELRY